MAVGIGAAGTVGLAIETTAGTYVAPTKFFPIRSESLHWIQATNWRRVIRGTTDPIGAVPGNGNVEGDIDMEVLDDVLVYFLKIARGTITKSGLTPDFEYLFKASHVAVPAKTASITVVRNGIVFGYTGVCVTGMSFSQDEGHAVVTFNLLGRTEAVQSAPTAVFDDNGPFGAGSYKISVPTGTQIFDADTFNFNVDDGGTVQTRLKDTLGAHFISYGERTAQATMERDFENRTEYDAFKNLTARSVTIRIQRAGATTTRFVELVLPSTVYDSYEVGLSGVGDLIRASTSYMGLHDATLGSAYSIKVGTDEDVVIP